MSRTDESGGSGDAQEQPLRLRLPATSANLGPGFDALGLALNFALQVEAVRGDEDTITASGRNAEVIQSIDGSLLLETYRDVLAQERVHAPHLSLALHNEIPLGMGCGSSAAALVAGVALAAHFGDLGWDRGRVLAEASRREGHPDNVAACVLGGLTASAMQMGADGRVQVEAANIPIAQPWRILVALPEASLSTKAARALLPEEYSKRDAIANVQAVALLTAAFATGRGDLLRTAMADRMHQPYRAQACALLPLLLPFAGNDGILGVALSGAGPSVLLVLHENADVQAVSQRVADVARRGSLRVEVLSTTIAAAADLGRIV